VQLNKNPSATDAPVFDLLSGDARPLSGGVGCVLLASGVSTTFGLGRGDTTQSMNIVNVQTATGKLH